VRRGPVAVLGGTFDRLHAGHLALLDAAFACASTVRVGVTTAAYLAQHPKPLGERIRPYAARRRSLERLLKRRYPGRRFSLARLDDPFGGSVRPGIDVLVVSEETRAGARAVNELRRRRHLPALKVVVVLTVRGADRKPISSRRMRAGEIDAMGNPEGRPLSASTNGPSRRAARGPKARRRSTAPPRRAARKNR
jgi:pantetheine-phosphate adenylyltransferase